MWSQPHDCIAFVYNTLMKKLETQSSQVEPSEWDLHEGKSTSFVETSALTIYSIKYVLYACPQLLQLIKYFCIHLHCSIRNYTDFIHK